MGSRRSTLAVTLVTGCLWLWGVPGCLTLADPVATGGSGAYIATGGSAPGGTAGASTGGAAGADASSGGDSGTVTTEDCQNGVDDDDDGEVDCADQDCAPGYTCATVPQGWTAVLALTQPWSKNLPPTVSCAGGVTGTRYFSGPATQASCTQCTCGALSGTCGNTPISCSIGDTACTNPAALSPTNCANFGAPGNGQISCSLGTTPLSNGSCTPSTTSLLNPDPWQSVVDACPPVAAGCAPGTSCVSTQDTSGHVACIVATGTTSCPSDWPVAKVVYTGGTDGRKCTSCKCSTNNVTCASDTFNLMLAPDCSDFGPFPVFTSTSCKSYTLSGQATWSIQRQPASKKPSGACTPTGGSSYGSMSTTGKATMCCRG